MLQAVSYVGADAEFVPQAAPVDDHAVPEVCLDVAHGRNENEGGVGRILGETQLELVR